VPFTLVNDGQYRTEDKYSQTKHNPEKANTAKQNYPGSVAFYDTWPENEVGLFYNVPESRQGPHRV